MVKQLHCLMQKSRNICCFVWFRQHIESLNYEAQIPKNEIAARSRRIKT